MKHSTHCRAIAAVAVAVVCWTASVASADEHHRDWNRLLGRTVTDGRVDYAALAANPAPLDAYLARLAAHERQWLLSRPADEQKAFWINAYNAFTVRLVLDHYPIDGIWDVTPLWRRALGETPFKVELAPLGHLHPEMPFGPVMTLDDIEHGVLRRQWSQDPRIHFALVCASTSCPKLQSHAYEGERLDEQLDDAARAFLADPTKNRLDATRGTLVLSRIFKWFAEDFERSAPLLETLAPWLPAPVAAAVAAGAVDVTYASYDWSLNDVAKPLE